MPGEAPNAGETPEYIKNLAAIVLDMLMLTHDRVAAGSLKFLTYRGIYASLPSLEVVMESAHDYRVVWARPFLY